MPVGLYRWSKFRYIVSFFEMITRALFSQVIFFRFTFLPDVNLTLGLIKPNKNLTLDGPFMLTSSQSIPCSTDVYCPDRTCFVEDATNPSLDSQKRCMHVWLWMTCDFLWTPPFKPTMSIDRETNSDRQGSHPQPLGYPLDLLFTINFASSFLPTYLLTFL